MHGEELVVGALVDEIVVGNRKLQAHQQCQNARKHEKQQRRADIEEADIGIVDGRQEFEAARRRPDALRASPVRFSAGAGRSGERSHWRTSR